MRPSDRVPPPLRVVGRTFDSTFPLPGPSNAGGRPPTRTKPAGKPPRKSSTSTPPRKANPKAQQTKPHPEPATTEVEAKLREPFEHDRKGNTSPERREQHRLQEQERRRKAKESGLCVVCRLLAIPDQSRCSTCAEKHRASRRRWQAQAEKQEQEELRKEPPSKGTRPTGRPRLSDNTVRKKVDFSNNRFPTPHGVVRADSTSFLKTLPRTSTLQHPSPP